MADYNTRQDSLDKKAAALHAEYNTLLEEIQKSGKHYSDFRRLKQTVFALGKIAKRNGIQPEKAAKSTTPPKELFLRGQTPAGRSVASPSAPPDLFNRGKKRDPQPKTTVSNTPPPDLFNRKGRVSDPHPTIPSPKAKAKADPKRKVLATSEEKEVD